MKSPPPPLPPARGKHLWVLFLYSQQILPVLSWRRRFWLARKLTASRVWKRCTPRSRGWRDGPRPPTGPHLLTGAENEIPLSHSLSISLSLSPSHEVCVSDNKTTAPFRLPEHKSDGRSMFSLQSENLNCVRQKLFLAEACCLLPEAPCMITISHCNIRTKFASAVSFMLHSRLTCPLIQSQLNNYVFFEDWSM